MHVIEYRCKFSYKKKKNNKRKFIAYSNCVKQSIINNNIIIFIKDIEFLFNFIIDFKVKTLIWCSL